jgi:hypothetical protein
MEEITVSHEMEWGRDGLTAPALGSGARRQGCCDNSPGKHATKHFPASRHAIMRSFEPGEDLKLVLRR